MRICKGPSVNNICKIYAQNFLMKGDDGVLVDDNDDYDDDENHVTVMTVLMQIMKQIKCQ